MTRDTGKTLKVFQISLPRPLPASEQTSCKNETVGWWGLVLKTKTSDFQNNGNNFVLPWLICINFMWLFRDGVVRKTSDFENIILHGNIPSLICFYIFHVPFQMSEMSKTLTFFSAGNGYLKYESRNAHRNPCMRNFVAGWWAIILNKIKS